MNGIKNPRLWGKPLLVLHLFFCCVWLFLFEARQQPPDWTLALAIWSVFGIQFTWGFTVGLIVGPGRANRLNLWWSLLLSFLPLYFTYFMFLGIMEGSPFWAIAFALTALVLVASETFCGVLLGAKAHIAVRGE